MKAISDESSVIVSKGKIARIRLSRPDLHNAFNGEVIIDLTDALEELARAETRILVLESVGRHFCAGADLEWMQAMAGYSEQENLEDARRLGRMFERLATFPAPTICRVQGAAVGGGVGLVTCCDLVVAGPRARFAFTEASLGILPAVISPFVVRRLGIGVSSRLFLTSEWIGVEEAKEIGLVTHLTADEQLLDEKLEEVIQQTLSGAPRVQTTIKTWLKDLPEMTWAEARKASEELIAKVRSLPEGQEGMAAFLAKRDPSWMERS